jgi:peptidoglycan/xylan/chitin deacetylase (PgdA/CDA1 family)
MTVSASEGSAKSAGLATMPLVLMYHSVSPYDEDPCKVTMTPERFEQHMRWLRSRGLRGVCMADLLSARVEGRGRGLVGLTFDDGYQDFFTYAMPIVQRYGFTATAFVLAGRLGGRDDWNRPAPEKLLLTADQVRQASHSGMEIGSHGLFHVALPEADDTQLSAETAHSRAILQELLGQQIRGFCYPSGRLDRRVVNAVRTAGYDYACAIGPSPAIGRHAITRTCVHDGDTPWRLDAKRIVSVLTVGNRIAVRRHRGNARSSREERQNRRPPTRHDRLNHDLEE